MNVSKTQILGATMAAMLTLGASRTAVATTLTVPGNASDARINYPGGGNPPPGISVANVTSPSVSIYANNGFGGTSDGRAILVFQLPDLGPVVNPFTAATFSVGGQFAGGFSAGNNTAAALTLLNGTASSSTVITNYLSSAGTGLGNIMTGYGWIGVSDSNMNTNWTTRSVSGTTLVNALNAAYGSGAGANQFVFFRLQADNSYYGSSGSYFNIGMSENTDASRRPALSLTYNPPPMITGAATATPFNTTYGTASAEQSFAVSGVNLTDNLIATAPPGFQVSSDNISYGAAATFTQTGGNASGTLYVRIKNNAPVGNYNSLNVVLTSTGASDVNVATTSSGNTVTAKALTVTGVAAASKMHDGTMVATVTGSLQADEEFGAGNSNDGKPYTGDVLTLTCTGSTFASTGPGTTISVTAGTFSVTGAAAGNYTVTQPTGLSLSADILTTATWTSASGGSWTNSGNWLTSVVGTGVDNTADFSPLDLTADATVTLDGARTIGGLVFADTTPSHNWTLDTGSGGSLTLDVTSGSPVVNVSNQTLTVGATVAGSDGLTKTGNGTLVLNAANTYTGPTTVSNGMLLVNGSLASGSAVIVAGGTLGGTGTVGGAVTVNSGGTLAPGASIGTLTLGALTLNNGGTTVMQIGDGPTADKAASAGAVVYGGALKLIWAGTTPATGTVDLFDGSGFSGAFSSVQVSNWPSAYRVNTNNLTTDGTIAITANAAPVAQNLTLGVSQGESASLLILSGKQAPVDADGDAMSVTNVALVTPANGGAVSIAGGTGVVYTASASFSGTDSFTYTVSDPFGAADTKTVTVTVSPASTGANLLPGSLSVNAGVATMQGFGIPGAYYQLQYTLSLNPVNWLDVANGPVQASPATGTMTLTDSNAGGPSRFYRTRYVSGP